MWRRKFENVGSESASESALNCVQGAFKRGKLPLRVPYVNTGMCAVSVHVNQPLISLKEQLKEAPCPYVYYTRTRVFAL